MTENDPSQNPNTPESHSPIVSETPPAQSVPQLSDSEIQSRKMAAGLLGILIGGLGIHKFYLGYQSEGIVMLLVTVLVGCVGGFLTCGILFPAAIIMPIIGMVEGILYLTKSDQEFAQTYIYNRKTWF